MSIPTKEISLPVVAKWQTSFADACSWGCETQEQTRRPASIKKNLKTMESCFYFAYLSAHTKRTSTMAKSYSLHNVYDIHSKVYKKF